MANGWGYSNALTAEVSHLIAEEAGSEKFQMAADAGLEITTPKWVFACQAALDESLYPLPGEFAVVAAAGATTAQTSAAKEGSKATVEDGELPPLWVEHAHDSFENALRAHGEGDSRWDNVGRDIGVSPEEAKAYFMLVKAHLKRDRAVDRHCRAEMKAGDKQTTEDNAKLMQHLMTEPPSPLSLPPRVPKAKTKKVRKTALPWAPGGVQHAHDLSAVCRATSSGYDPAVADAAAAKEEAYPQWPSQRWRFKGSQQHPERFARNRSKQAISRLWHFENDKYNICGESGIVVRSCISFSGIDR
jgi:hypothetical protein